MNRPTELIEKLKVSSKAADAMRTGMGDISNQWQGNWNQRVWDDHINAAFPENILTLLRWVEVLERALELQEMDSANWKEASIEQAARELEARDE